MPSWNCFALNWTHCFCVTSDLSECKTSSLSFQLLYFFKNKQTNRASTLKLPLWPGPHHWHLVIRLCSTVCLLNQVSPFLCLGFGIFVCKLQKFPFICVFVSFCCCNKLHKLGALKQHRFITFQLYCSEVQNESQWAKIKISGLRSFWML